MNQTKPLPAWSVSASKLYLIVTALLLMVAQTAFAQAPGATFNFNMPNQFSNIPTNVLGTNDWIVTFLPNGIGEKAGLFESHDGGVGSNPAPGAGALDIRAGNNDITGVLVAMPFDFSQVDARLKASVMLKIRLAGITSNNRATQIGFVSSTNTGINANAGQTFMTVIMQSTAQPALSYQLRQQNKALATGTATSETTPVNVPNATSTLTAGNWYKLTATFVRTSATTYTVEAMLEDFGHDGLTPPDPQVVASYPPTSITAAELATATKLYFALRTNASDAGVDLWDDIHIQASTGPVGVLPLDPTTTIPHGGFATLYAKATGDGPYSYQWNRNGSPIPGQTAWKLVLPRATAGENGVTYNVTVAGAGGASVTSSTTTIAVSANPLAVVGVGSVDGSHVGVRFNQPVMGGSAGVLANYTINGATPKSVAVLQDGVSVLLVPNSLLTGPYTVGVQNVLDLSGVAIAASTANGRVEGFVGMDLNNASPPGANYSFGAGQFEIVGGGADIFGTSDQFRYVFKQRTGDFDVAMRVPYVDVVRGPTKAGFEVRDSLAPQGVQVLAAVNPSFPGRNSPEGTVRQAYNQASVAWGSTPFMSGAIKYPDVWLRLRRNGNVFTRYTSANGVAWTQDGQVTVPLMPETVYFGLAVCSVANGVPARAVIESYQELSATAGASITLSVQPPAAVSVNAGAAATIALGATWSGSPTNELQVSWQRSNGSGGFTNIPTAGATGSYTTANLFATDNGAQFRAILRAPGAPDVISDVTTVTVNDTAAPTATLTVPASSLNHLSIAFNEPVSAATALNLANYTANLVSPATALNVTGAAFTGPDQRTVILTVSQTLGAGEYTVAISGVQDLGGNPIAPVTTAYNHPIQAPQQVAVIEMINNIGDGSIGTGMVNYQNSGKFVNRIPDHVFYNNSFSFSTALADTGWNNYGARVFSYFVPPTTGNYKFYVASDDSSILLMNTNAVDSINPDGVVEIGRLAAFTGTYTLMGTGGLTNIALVGGQKYYLEGRWKEGGGGDGIRVAVRLSDNNTAPPATEAIPQSQLAYPTEAALRYPIVSEYYLGPTGAALADLDNAMATAAFVARIPSLTAFQKDFAVNRDLSNTTRDNFIGRMFSYFVPPFDGLYRIWMRSDDSSRIYMNTNAVDSINRDGAVLLGTVSGFVAAYNTVAQNVPLKAGQRYYTEVRWKEGGGGDGVSVVFRDQADTTAPTQSTADATQVEVEPGDNFQFPYEAISVGPAVVTSLTPQNPTVAIGQRVTFSIPGVGGATPATVTWYKNGLQVYANANSFTTEPATAADNNAVFTVVASNPQGTVVLSTTLTVQADSGDPLFFAAVGSHTDVVRLTFSEALDRATAVAASNYSFSPPLGVIKVNFDEVNRNAVLITTSPQSANTKYTVTASGIRDVFGNSLTAASQSFSGWSYGGKGLLVEFFSGPGGTSVYGNLFTSLEYMYNNMAFAGYIPEFRFGTETQVGNNFTGVARNNYGVRVSGLFRPPTSGLYRFFLRGDDETRLFMNTNGPSRYGMVSVARNLGANSATYIAGTGDSQSTIGHSYTPILDLRAETEYYMEGYMKEGGGGDYIHVAMTQIFDPANDYPRDPGYPSPTINSVAEMVPGEYFRPPGNPDLGPIVFGQTPPASITAAQNSLVNLVVDAQGVPAAFLPATSYQWQRLDSGSGQFNNIEGATGTNLSFYATPADAGQYRVILRMPTADRTFTTTVTVTGDTVPPTVVSVSATNRFDRLVVRFSEPVTSASAGNKNNYQISPAVTVNSVTVIDATTVELNTAPLSQDTAYTVTVSNIADNAGLTSGSVQKNFTSWNLSQGFWKVEIFNNTGVGSVDVNAFLGAPNYLANTPDEVRVISGRLSTFAYDPAGALRDNYGARVTTMVTPPSDGNYQFFVRVDDQALVFLSTDDTPDNLDPTPIASDTAACCQAFQETGVSETSAPIPLIGGKRYYLMAVFKEAGGGDWMEIAWRKEGDLTPAGALTPIPAQFLSLYGDPATPLEIAQQPASQTVFANRSATLTVRGVSPLGASYQWQRNGENIPNATSATYTTPPLQIGDSGVTYRAVVSGYGRTLPSNEATITVVNDSAGPVLVSARTYSNPNTVTVRFDEPVAVQTTTLFSDDFAGAELDAGKWTVSSRAFEAGESDITVTQADGVVTFAGTGTLSFWGGASIATVPSFTASPSQLLRFGVDRVTHAGVGTATRTTVRIANASGTSYVVFSQNVGEGGWEFNRLVSRPGDNGTGNGTDLPALDVVEAGSLHRMELVANGSTVKLYVDGILGGEVLFPVSSGIKFEVASYVRAAGDTISASFDNAKVESIQPLGTYTISGATVNAVEFTSRADTLVLRTSSLNPATSHTLSVSGVVDLLGNNIAANASIGVDQSIAIPSEFGQTFAGYQDDFEGARRDPRWIARGLLGGDVYNQAGGVLRVTTASSDPNHLLFEAPYDRSNQEILTRVRIINAGNGDAVRGGVAAAVDVSPATYSQGFNWQFRDEGTFGRHMEFLDDLRSWGPEYDFDWSNNTWYWVRFKSAPNTDGGEADLFGKIWKGDGTEPEPEDWQTRWDRAGRSGFAGLAASSNGGLLEMEVDYFLLKANGLSSITATISAFGSTPEDPEITFTFSGGVLNIEWSGGGELFSAPTVVGPWSATGDSDGARQITIPAGAGAQFYRVERQ